MLHIVKLYPQSLRALINEDPESLEMEESGEQVATCFVFRLELIICYYLVNKAHRPKLHSFFQEGSKSWEFPANILTEGSYLVGGTGV